MHSAAEAPNATVGATTADINNDVAEDLSQQYSTRAARDSSQPLLGVGAMTRVVAVGLGTSSTRFDIANTPNEQIFSTATSESERENIRAFRVQTPNSGAGDSLPR